MGAAMVTASLLTGKAPPSIASSLSQARNEAVHQGKSPTLAKAEEHLVAIATIVRAFEDALNSQQCVNEAPFAVALMGTALEELLQRDAAAKGLKVTTGSPGTALAAQNPAGVREPLQEHINRLRSGSALLTVR